MVFLAQEWLSKQAEDESFQFPSLDLTERSADDAREFLVTNGLGSYASANIWGANTRRYHGLLVAALQPPVRRTVMFSRIDEEIVSGDFETRLSTNFWKSGHVNPRGFSFLQSFYLLPVPTWIFEVPDGLLIKQVGMMPGKQQVAVGYTFIEQQRSDGVQKTTRATASEAAESDAYSASNGTFDEPISLGLRLHLLANYRDFHNATHASEDWYFRQELEEGLVRLRAYDTAQPLNIYFDNGTYRDDACWYRDYYWPRENERGLEDGEDCFHAGVIETTLRSGQSVTVFGAIDSVLLRSIDEVVKISWAHKSHLLTLSAVKNAPQERQLLTLAADDFVVQRQSTRSNSIIAGYHWFSDWGRDSMISLPGLTLSTGRARVAKSVLETFGRYLSQGMLPNFFPDSGQAPEYNTSDATLWWASALLKYYTETTDVEFIREQLPLLEDVVGWHLKGTRHGLHVDSDDFLVTADDAHVQLTWMDAKVGDLVVTPRTGKAVEINALWYNFLKTIEFLYCATGSATLNEYPPARLGLVGAHRKAEYFSGLAEKVKASFEVFWNTEYGCFFDYIGNDGRVDDAVRPNQLLAASLKFPVATKEQARSMLDIVERELLTPLGLRTLSPRSADYKAHYGNGKSQANQYDRDITYHQGTVWPWLLGPWVDARVYAYGDSLDNIKFISEKLKPILSHLLTEGCVGSISEIFDGDAPQRARGCIAQAWSVGELLRVFKDYRLEIADTAGSDNRAAVDLTSSRKFS